MESFQKTPRSYFYKAFLTKLEGGKYPGGRRVSYFTIRLRSETGIVYLISSNFLFDRCSLFCYKLCILMFSDIVLSTNVRCSIFCEVSCRVRLQRFHDSSDYFLYVSFFLVGEWNKPDFPSLLNLCEMTSLIGWKIIDNKIPCLMFAWRWLPYIQSSPDYSPLENLPP